jgi:glycine cleavage system H protein
MTGAKEVKSDRLYTSDHEWALSQGDEVLIGISAFAVDQLGDITLVDLSTVPGQHLDGHQSFGTIESVKTLSDLFSPVAGTVLRINQDLLDKPEWVNEDCWDKAWMIAIRPDQPLKASDDLMDPTTYATHLEQTG